MEKTLYSLLYLRSSLLVLTVSRPKIAAWPKACATSMTRVPGAGAATAASAQTIATADFALQSHERSRGPARALKPF